MKQPKWLFDAQGICEVLQFIEWDFGVKYHSKTQKYHNKVYQSHWPDLVFEEYIFLKP